MTEATKATLKGYFNTGDVPTEANFADLIDSCYNEVVNVKNYGATGDGATNDTAAITLAIAALPTTGGVLFFPPGIYITSGGFTLANPAMVIGCGKAGLDGSTGAITLVKCSSATASLFTVTASDAIFRDIGLSNNASTTPTAGAGITVQVDSMYHRVDFIRVSVSGFYIDLDIQGGCSWVVDQCYILGPVKYGIKIRNTANADEGDWMIANTSIFAAFYNSDAGIRIESSGGAKITNCKFNMSFDGKKFNHGLDLAPSLSSTVILLVTNCSFENVRGNGINMAAVTSWGCIVINGNQFHLYGGTGYAISLTSAFDNKIDYVIIANNILGATASSNTAIMLTKVRYVRLTGNIWSGFTALLMQTSCTDIIVSPTDDGGTFTADDATPAVVGRNLWTTANVNPTTITMFDNGYEGQQITVIIGDANTTIDFSATNLKGNAGVDWTPTTGDHLTAVFDGTNWYCDISDNTA